jgi:hypothetical protein
VLQLDCLLVIIIKFLPLQRFKFKNSKAFLAKTEEVPVLISFGGPGIVSFGGHCKRTLRNTDQIL